MEIFPGKGCVSIDCLAQRDAEERKATALKIIGYALDAIFQVFVAKINQEAAVKVLL
jgi:hypothetical protein